MLNNSTWHIEDIISYMPVLETMTGKFKSLKPKQHAKMPATKSRSWGAIDGHNWLNETARELNNQIRQHRQAQPSTATSVQWHEEYLSSGCQYRMTWAAYRAQRLRQWREHNKVKAWRFGTGKYQGKLIGSIIKNNIGYIEWVLENQPQGKTAKQIVNFITRYPAVLEQVKPSRA